MAQSFPLLTIDTLIHTLCSTLFSPVPAILLPLTHLSISPQSFHDPSSQFRYFLLFYTLPILVFHFLTYLDQWLAYSKNGVYGPPRQLEWKSEIVVITGGAGGLGRVLAERFARRGVGVAVLDVRGGEGDEGTEWEEMGVKWYRCDVGDRKQVMEVAGRIREEVGRIAHICLCDSCGRLCSRMIHEIIS